MSAAPPPGRDSPALAQMREVLEGGGSPKDAHMTVPGAIHRLEMV